MKKKKAAFIAAVAMAALLLFSSCSPKKGSGGTSSIEPNGSPSSDTSSVPEVPKAKNPLTGEPVSNEEEAKLRPVAVMINNIKPALPQRGVTEADIIYELPVEGGVTRLMAVFSDYEKLPAIGSIRSARHDYVELVKPLDALYIHIGWSDAGREAIEREKISNINGLTHANLAFYKDEERAKTRSVEHCWYTNAQLVKEGIEKLEIEMTDRQNKPLFKFSEDDSVSVTATGTDALKAELTVSPGVKASFTYNDSTGLYDKTQYGEPHIDETTNTAVAVKNVFLMYTDVSMMADGKHREIDLSQGKGFYLSAGKSVPVTFKKSSVDSLIEVYSQSGEIQTINQGSSYFAIIPDGEAKNLAMQ